MAMNGYAQSLHWAKPKGWVSARVSSSGTWRFTSFFDNLPKDSEQQRADKTAGVVCFGDKIFALLIIWLVIEGRRHYQVERRCPGQT